MRKPAPVYTLDFVLHPEQDAGYHHFENASTNPFQPNPTEFPACECLVVGGGGAADVLESG